jgi:hypothetical protein
VKSARLLMTADDSGKCWVNGQLVGSIESPLGNYRFLTVDIGSLLKPGKNLLAVEGYNGAGGPNPAGVIAVLRIEYRDGPSQTVYTDKLWQSAKTVKGNWNRDAAAADGWTAAKEFGPLCTPPWQEFGAVSADTQVLPEEELVHEVMTRLGVPPDFDFQPKSGTRSLRFTHRTLDGADVFFVANKFAQTEEALCAFRIHGKRPEIWRPDTGKIEHPAVYDEADGVTRLPIHFEPFGSVFVVFREDAAPLSQPITAVEMERKEVLGTTWKSPSPAADVPKPVNPPIVKFTVDADQRLTVQAWQPGKFVLRRADGSTRSITVNRLPPPMDLAGPWEVRFSPGGGAPDNIVFDKLISWSDHPDPGVKYYSGTAAYMKTFVVSPETISENRRLRLSLGDVEIMAEVTLNGKNLGILWKPPFHVDITDAVKPGENTLEVKVVNLLVNRQIGDEFLPEDSDRNPDGTLRAWPKWVLEGKSSPTGRHTFTSWRLWHKNDPLQPSGLLGPVRIVSGKVMRLFAEAE